MTREARLTMSCCALAIGDVLCLRDSSTGNVYTEKEKKNPEPAADNVLVEISGEVLLENWGSRSSIPLSLGCCDG